MVEARLRRLRPRSSWLVAALLVALPLHYFSLRFGSTVVTLFDVLLAVAALGHAARMLADRRFFERTVSVLRLRVFRRIHLLLGWLCVAAVIGVLRVDAEQLEGRPLVGLVSAFEGMYLLPLIVVAALGATADLTRILRFVALVWWGLVLLAFPQELAYLLGLPVNAITLAETAANPSSVVLDVRVLRPYSIVGEPRDLAAICVPFLLFYLFMRGRPVPRALHVLVLIALGALLAAVTFYGYLVLFCAYLVARAGDRLHRAVLFRAVTVGVGTLILVGVSSIVNECPSGQECKPRLMIVFEELRSSGALDTSDSPEPLPETPPPRLEPGTPPPAGAGPRIDLGVASQAPDLMAYRYVRDLLLLRLDPLDTLVGSGLGTFTQAVAPYYESSFGYDPLEEGLLVNSRILPFTLLVETGLVGLFLFGWVIWTAYRSVATSGIARGVRLPLLLLLAAFVLSSTIQTSYVFAAGIGIVLALTLRERQDDADSRRSGSNAVGS
ncbi:MAG TPA: hypothetical protein VM184_04410 [Gaiellaceae bacterium]|nr:hypothetical protein [Gaiellaceae bacterium]